MYFALKHVHLSAVALSFLLFGLRACWMLRDSPMLQQRWTRIIPHIIDTVLLASAIGLAVVIQQYPFVDSWLTAKVCALLGYIILGSIALKRGRTRKVRILALGGAVSCAVYIVSVALNHHPFPWAV